MAARLGGDLEAALVLFIEAADLLQGGGLERDAARAEGMAADVEKELGRVEQALERLARAYAAIDNGSNDEAVADVASLYAASLFMHGDSAEALRLGDIALRIADGRRLGQVLVRALITKGIALSELGRPAESMALLTHAVQLAVDHDLGDEAVRAYFNLADSFMMEARFADAEGLLDRGLQLARRRGDRQGERRLLAQSVVALIALGRFDEALATIAALRERDDVWADQGLMSLPHLLAIRGDTAALRALIAQPHEASTGWAEVNMTRTVGRAVVLRETGSPDQPLDDVRAAVIAMMDIGLSHVPLSFSDAVDCAFASDNVDLVSELVGHVDTLAPAQLLPMLEAETARARALLAAHRGDGEEADRWFKRAVGRFRELGTPFYLARTQLEHAEALARSDSDHAEVAALRAEATGVFEALGAKPWIDRARALGSAVPA
jgi:tetratricopeptide (TPR) repeat protein